MRIGTLISLPDAYSRFARVKDQYGVAYTVDPGEVPEAASVGDEYAYKVEIWSNDSGLAYGLEED